MDECHIEMIRKIGFGRLGKLHSEETILKMKGAPLHKKYPPKCNKCNSRDVDMCARHNVACFTAREEEACIKRYMQRKEHPDYIKKGVKHV